MKGFEKFLEWAKKHDWIIETAEEGKYKLPEIYKGKIGYIEQLAEKYKCICNPDEDAWLVFGEHISEHGEDGFAWDTFKNITLNACDTDDEFDKQLYKEAYNWWEKHYPFYIAVYDCYEFYAVNTDDGSVVYGMEPMFEDAEKVADSVDEFFENVIAGKVYFGFAQYFEQDENDEDRFIG
ncbi:MAG: hypothetical protein IJ446_10700 [Oscillospiraceae bacterium]|nr:hypothetical protein [Oscillospiraceae bacterium]